MFEHYKKERKIQMAKGTYLHNWVKELLKERPDLTEGNIHQSLNRIGDSRENHN